MNSLLFAVILAWNASPTPNVSYRLKYGTQPQQYTVVQDAGTQLTATVNSLSPGTYYFAAFAYNVDGESGASNEVVYVQAAPTPTPTPTPVPTPTPTPTPTPVPTPTPTPWADTQITDLRVVVGSRSSITITWTQPAGAVDHQLYWDNDEPTGPLLYRRNDPGPPHTMTPFSTPTSVYYFEVRAINAAGELNRFSNRVQWPDGPPPTPTPTPTPTPAPTPTPVRKVTVITKRVPGASVAISAPANVAGKPFVRWIGDTNALANPFDRTTTLTVPSTIDPSVEATYQP